MSDKQQWRRWERPASEILEPSLPNMTAYVIVRPTGTYCCILSTDILGKARESKTNLAHRGIIARDLHIARKELRKLCLSNPPK